MGEDLINISLWLGVKAEAKETLGSLSTLRSLQAFPHLANMKQHVLTSMWWLIFHFNLILNEWNCHHFLLIDFENETYMLRAKVSQVAWPQDQVFWPLSSLRDQSKGKKHLVYQFFLRLAHQFSCWYILRTEGVRRGKDLIKVIFVRFFPQTSILHNLDKEHIIATAAFEKLPLHCYI